MYKLCAVVCTIAIVALTIVSVKDSQRREKEEKPMDLEKLKASYAPFLAMMNGGKNMVEGFNIPGVKFVNSEEDPNTKYMELPDGLRLIFRNGTYDGYYDPNLKKGVY